MAGQDFGMVSCWSDVDVLTVLSGCSNFFVFLFLQAGAVIWFCGKCPCVRGGNTRGEKKRSRRGRRS